MDLSPTTLELDAALLQAAITFGLAALFAVLHSRYRKPYLGWWAVAWTMFGVRIGAISTFLVTADRFWLFAHQVLTGWTALATLWATLVFARGTRWRSRYLLVLLFPPLWSILAIYRLETFLLAALPAVVFLSGATAAAGVAFFRFRRQTGSSSARFLGWTFLLWALHHLDYPLLRARGAWTPWGYYLDIAFILAIGSGTLLLLIEELRTGLRTLSAMAGDLHRPRGEADALDALLTRPLDLAGVRGSAFYDVVHAAGLTPTVRFTRGAGVCREWGEATSIPDGEIRPTILQAVDARRPRLTAPGGRGFALVLPVFREDLVMAALVIVGEVGDPFTALDDDFLLTLGRQMGTALERSDLHARLARRQADLERLSARMIRQHEQERHRLSRELHDETAQVFSAMKLQLGALREGIPHELTPRIDHLVGMVDTGMRSIRNVTEALRPSVLDDLGLVPALRALVSDFGSRTGIACAFDDRAGSPALTEDAELALFRALQEALSNVARHANASQVAVTLSAENGALSLQVCDNGIGPTPRTGTGTGLTGMQERIAQEGGTVEVEPGPAGGTVLRVTIPRPSIPPAGADA